ncbi:MAG: four helix bundle protein [Saprospiraceae bacterium]|nr:four helix bundle protein [Candidatus Opimibacter iunctus]
MQDFRNLLVWQKAHQLTLEVYCNQIFSGFENYGLTSQTRRACSPFRTNQSEGTGKFNRSGFQKICEYCFWIIQ